MSSGKTAVEKIRILIVDDHPIVCEGLTSLIEHESDLKVCGEASNIRTALQKIEQLRPDLAVVDISLEGRNGLELVKDVFLRYPELPILVMSVHDEAVYAQRALLAGAKGYIMKDKAGESVLKAIRRVLAGEVYLSEKMTVKTLRNLVGGSQLSPLEPLSDRELEVLSLIGEGQSVRQIAARLGLSAKTIETYRTHIRKKLKVANSSELLKCAIQWVRTETQLK